MKLMPKMKNKLLKLLDTIKNYIINKLNMKPFLDKFLSGK